MRASQSSFKRIVVTALVAAFAAIALTGCITVQVTSKGSSESASASAESASSSAASIETLSSSAATPSSSSASATSSSAATPTSGSEVDYVNEQEGYMFKIDKSFTYKTDGGSVHVYTQKEGEAPFFSASIMKNSSGQSVEQLLNGSGQKAVEKHGDKIVAGPVAKKIQAGNRTVLGYDYVVEENGKRTGYFTYAEDANGAFLIWTGVAPADDVVTPAAMERAMETFQFKTA